MTVLYNRHVLVPLDKDLVPHSFKNIINMADIDILIVCESHRESVKAIMVELNIRHVIYMKQNGSEITVEKEGTRKQAITACTEEPLELKVC